MKIIVSKHSGFCFGVKRAIDLTEKNLNTNQRVYSLGSLIHNRYVVCKLKAQGLKVIGDVGDIDSGICIIPSHGIDPERIKKRERLVFVDTTCPFVFKAQDIVKKLMDAGYQILILGDKDHPEVRGLMGISKGMAEVIGSEKDAASFSPKEGKISLLSQTTQSLENFRSVTSKLLEKGFQELRIFNTICRDVIERQVEAKKIAKTVDLVLVIGGKNSANTKRLSEICRNFTKTYQIENEKEIKEHWFKGIKSVGIVTGASTPGEFIAKAKDKIKEIKGE